MQGERSLLGLEFLKTDDIRLSLREPRQQVRQALIDVVDVEGCDLQNVFSELWMCAVWLHC